MSEQRVDEIRRLLREQKRVSVSNLSERFGVSEVSVRKYLATLEREGFAVRFYGGAALAERPEGERREDEIYGDPLRYALARTARTHIVDGDSIFIGSGRTCCVLARELTGFSNLTVFTNNITALADLVKNGIRVYLIGGEVTTTDHSTLFSSWESPQSNLENIFVNKAFTSASGLDAKAGLTVDSIISTHIFKQIPAMAHEWYVMADSGKFDKISIYPVGDLSRIHTLITDAVPERYAAILAGTKVQTVAANR